MPLEPRSDRPVLGWADGTAIPGTHFRYALASSDTDGRFSLLKATMPAGTFVWPHTHAHEDEVTFVHRGRIGARVGERDLVVEEGEFLFKPRGVPHAMWSLHDGDSLLHEIITPAGFEGLFEEMGRLDVEGREQSAEERADRAARYGLHVNEELIPELVERHSLRP